MVAHEELRSAFLAGDVVAIAAYFASDAGRARMIATEAHFARERHSLGPGLSRFNPWYTATHGPFDASVCLLVKALELGHSNVIEWLFEGPRASQMRATLSSVFSDVCAAAAQANDLPILDLLLSSRVFTDATPDTAQKQVLNALVASEPALTNSIMLELLIAHGANIESPEILAQCASVAGMAQVDLLLHNGARVVGADVLVAPALKCNAEMVRQLIKCGADANAGNGSALYNAARKKHFGTVKVLLAEGFADVGAETVYGGTALGAATAPRSVLGHVRRDPAEPKTSSAAQVRNILLQHGANRAHDMSNWQLQ